MNILVVSMYGLYGDLTASFIHNQAKAYAALGHRVRVLILVPLGKKQPNGQAVTPFLQRTETDGVELFYLRFLSLSNFGKRHFNAPSATCALAPHLSILTKEFRPDVIHAHTFGLDEVVGAWLKERLACPLVLTTHGETLCENFWKQNKPLIKPRADKADTVVCVSSLLKRDMEQAGVSAPLDIILNGFNVHAAAKNPEKPPVSLIQAGFLVPRKKADVTIRAFADLKRRYPEATLSIVGSGSEQQRLEALSRELAVDDRVCFHGFLPNRETLAQMAKARFFVMPSVDEGFGIVYLEAMANGCIAIGTEGEGIADLIVSGENGFLVPPDDPGAIVAVIEWCIQHPEEAAAIAERGRQDAVGLTWERNAGQYIALFQALQKKI